jgi:proline dehydrogenase
LAARPQRNEGTGISLAKKGSPDPGGFAPDLGDTRIAFAARTDRELREAELLFRMLGSPLISAMGQRLTLAALAVGLPVTGIIKRTIFKQFCGGETIDESLVTAEKLYASHVGTILDHSVEGQDDESSLDATVSEILRTVTVAGKRREIPFCVFKPTGIARGEILRMVSAGEPLEKAATVEWARVRQRMDTLCSAAFQAGVPMLIDAEESWLQQAVDDLVTEMMERYNRERPIIFNTIQFYRHDRLAFLHESLRKASDGGYHLGIKLVRGAYMEKERERAAEKGYPSPIHKDKAAVDRDYDEALRVCMRHIGRMAIVAGSHNEHSTLLLAELMDAQGVDHDDARIWFSQLLGMSDNISYNMASAGFNVVKYVPYGPVRKVLPYLIRRAAENSSVAGQTGRELRLLRAEIRRRKQNKG